MMAWYSWPDDGSLGALCCTVCAEALEAGQKYVIVRYPPLAVDHYVCWLKKIEAEKADAMRRGGRA